MPVQQERADEDEADESDTPRPQRSFIMTEQSHYDLITGIASSLEYASKGIIHLIHAAYGIDEDIGWTLLSQHMEHLMYNFPDLRKVYDKKEEVHQEDLQDDRNVTVRQFFGQTDVSVVDYDNFTLEYNLTNILQTRQ